MSRVTRVWLLINLAFPATGPRELRNGKPCVRYISYNTRVMLAEVLCLTHAHRLGEYFSNRVGVINRDSCVGWMTSVFRAIHISQQANYSARIYSVSKVSVVSVRKLVDIVF